MNISCSAEPCPIILDGTCVFYTGANLIYTGIVTNDSISAALYKIDQKFKDAAVGYVFQNGLIQAIPGGPVKLGGTLIENTVITSGPYTLALTGTIESSAFITTGGTSSQFVKGDGSLDTTSYQPAGNYITDLYGDGTATGPGSAAFTLSNTGVIANTYGSATKIPIITVDDKGRITWATSTTFTVPPALLLFSGDVTGAGYTNTTIALTLATVLSTPGTYGSATTVPVFTVNAKGLVTGITQVPFSGGGSGTVTAVTASTPLASSGGTTPNITIQQSSGSQDGYLSSTDWTTFNNKQDAISLTTTGTSGAATFIGNVLNVPDYSAGFTTPNLQQVTDVGNITTNEIIINNNDNYGFIHKSNGILGVQSYVSDSDNESFLKVLSPSDNTVYSLYSQASIQYSQFGNKTVIQYVSPTNLINTIQVPDASGIFALSVNGVGAATDGSITIPIGTGTVTSVGLSMPSAFTVTNSPVTSIGTLTVTGAGVASQYVRGDGTLANFPANPGGGSSVSYYLNGSVNQGIFGGNTYYEMSRTANTGATANFTRTAASGNGYITQFITSAGDPALLNIPAGNWDFQIYFSASSNGGSPKFYTELYKYNGGLTLIASGSTSPETITGGTTKDVYLNTLTVPATSLLITDRLAIRIYVIPDGKDITMYTQDSNLAEVHTTFSTGLAALNGLTTQVQYFAVGTTGTDFNIASATDTHTFNLPTASTTNRGALSSSDWTTFNDKVTSLSAGTGISIGGTTTVPIVTNTAPDQTVVLTGGTGISTSGTYPSFTITNTSPDQTVALTAGTGIGITGTYPNFTITNSSPSSGGTVTSVAALTLGTTGTNLSSSVANSTTTPVITLNVPDASATNRGALTSTDWTNFNTAYTNRITSLTTTGTSGAATLVGNTLNIPQYAGATVGGSTGNIQYNNGTTFAGSNNLFWDNSNTRLGIAQSSPTSRFHLNFNQNSVTQSDANGILLANSTAAIAGTQSISPAIVWQGNGWKTTATAASQDVRFRADVLPVQGAANPTATWQLASSINGGAYSNVFTVSSAGVASFTSNIQAPLQIGSSANGNILLINTNNGAYRTTNAGANINSNVFFDVNAGSFSSAGAGGIAHLFDATNQFVYTVGNGTNRIARAAIQVSGSNNTAGAEAGDLLFLTQSGGTAMSEKMRIFGGGNVGIGTATDNGYRTNITTAATANAGLYVFGSTYNVGNLNTATQIAIGATSYLSFDYRLTNAGGAVVPKLAMFVNGGQGTAGNNSLNYDTTNQLTFAVGNGTRAIARAAIQTIGTNNTAGSESGDLLFLTQSGGTAISEKMRITSAGNVGINSTAPQNTLDVIRGSAGTMGRAVYETASFSYNGDMKFGLYTSSANSTHGAGLSFAQTNLTITATGYYPGFDHQYVYGSTPGANAMRYNYTERNSGGTVINYAANLMQMYGDGKVVFSPVASGVSTTVKMLINTSTDDTVNTLQVNGSVKATQFRLSALNTAPSSAADTGTTGEIRIVNGFIYVCVATNTWQRAAIATW